MKPRLLDLFCGAGGAAMGYHRAGFEVVGVDIKPQPHYPFEFHVEDALRVAQWTSNPVFREAMGFVAIHASPPCQAYIQRNKNLVTKWPRLIEPTRQAVIRSDCLYVIENVPAAPLRASLLLCGTMFGLPLLRHRIFEVSPPIALAPAGCNHWGTVAAGNMAAVYGRGGKGHRGWTADGQRTRGARNAPGPEWTQAMGIDWMTTKELSQAIPPAYTEWIGRQLMAVIAVEQAAS